jgi:hypothetical protein
LPFGIQNKRPRVGRTKYRGQVVESTEYCSIFRNYSEFVRTRLKVL